MTFIPIPIHLRFYFNLIESYTPKDYIAYIIFSNKFGDCMQKRTLKSPKSHLVINEGNVRPIPI